MNTNNHSKSPENDCGCDPYLLSLVETKESEVKKPKSLTGLFLAGATGLTALGISALCFPFVAPALRRVCLPYVPASTSQVENVVKALTLSKAKGRLIDLGSGDGRIVRIQTLRLWEAIWFSDYLSNPGLCCCQKWFPKPWCRIEQSSSLILKG